MPDRQEATCTRLYDGCAILSDPIHGYIIFTTPISYGPKPLETTEKALIDSPWMQRLRYIAQLQSARWVYPSAEHSRFVHSLGAMHLAGVFARHLYPSLKEVVPDAPSAPFIESLLRISALLHDIGHGPFCHFFDDHFLGAFNLTHEKLGQAIIRESLAPLIAGIRRAPGGNFAPGESLDPEQVAFLIHKDKSFRTPPDYPRWLVLLKPLFSGIFTADNLDYVLRDSYMCGVAVGPVDVHRLMHYTFFSPSGLTLHKAGLSALVTFLNARSYLYANVYYHRTVRSFDLHLGDIFRKTIDIVFPYHPLKQLDLYADLTDWSLIQEIRRWRTNPTRRDLFDEWQRLLMRDVKWKMAYDTTLPIRNVDTSAFSATDLETRIRALLPSDLRTLPFRVDIASSDPRPMNPATLGEKQIYVYTQATQSVSASALAEYIHDIPAQVIQCRLYTLSHDHDKALSHAAETALRNLVSPI